MGSSALLYRESLERGHARLFDEGPQRRATRARAGTNGRTRTLRMVTQHSAVNASDAGKPSATTASILTNTVGSMLTCVRVRVRARVKVRVGVRVRVRVRVGGAHPGREGEEGLRIGRLCPREARRV